MHMIVPGFNKPVYASRDKAQCFSAFKPRTCDSAVVQTAQYRHALLRDLDRFFVHIKPGEQAALPAGSI